MVTSIALSPAYRKADGLWNLNIAAVEREVALVFEVAERSFIGIPGRTVAGNHHHSRQEAFVGVGGLMLHWLDEQGAHQEAMMPDGQLRLFIIPSGVAHAVVNPASSEANLLEFADGPQRDVEPVQVI